MHLVKKICIAVFAILVAWFVFNVCAARILVKNNPEKASKLFSSYSEALIAQNANLIKGRGFDEKLIRSNAAKILKRAPLNDDAFLHLAMADYAATKSDLNLELLQTAKARNARNRTALANLFQYHFNNENFTNALSELEILYRLDPEKASQYLTVFGVIYTDPLGEKAIEERLTTAPVWGNYFLINQLNQITDPDKLLRQEKSVTGYTQAISDPDIARNLSERYIKKLVQAGLYSEAWNFWMLFQPAVRKKVKNRVSVLYNHDFTDWSAVAPFNWELFSTDEVISERNQNEGLFVSFNVGSPKIITRQYVLMPSSGTLRLILDSQLSFNQNQSTLECRLTCLPDRSQAYSVTLNESGLISTLLIDNADSLKDCPFAVFELWGIPGLYQKRISGSISSITLATDEVK